MQRLLVADLVYPPVIVLVKTLWKVLGLRFDFSGAENIPRKDGAILAINHVSYLDFAITGTAALPANRYVRFMAKKEIFANKLAGPLMRGMHHISVDRSSGSASFVAALRALKAGEIIGIFPEGTTSTSFEIKELKSGAVRLAMGAGVPIIPVGIGGSERVMPKGSKMIYPRKCVVIIGKPIETVMNGTARLPRSALKGLSSNLSDELQRLFDEAQRLAGRPNNY